jgi:CheY-like chemotaxis protein
LPVASESEEGEAKISHETSILPSDDPAIGRIARYVGRPRLLWVDDHPENNAYEMRSLSLRGWELIVETDTNSAVSRFRREAPFDAVISDLCREEAGNYDADAGLKLLHEVRSEDEYVPVLIYTTEDASANRGKELVNAGATIVTASSLELQKGLGRSVGFALERRVSALLDEHGFVSDEQEAQRLHVDFVGRRGDRVLAVETTVVTPRTTLNRFQDAAWRLLRAAEMHGVTDLIVVTPRPIEVQSPPKAMAEIKILSYEELGGFLAAIP